MTFKDLTMRFLHLVSVPKCVSCKDKLEYGDRAICQKCSARFDEIKTRNCSKCAKILSECSCSTDYLERHFVKRLVKVFRYRQTEDNLPANSIIYSLKRDDRADVLKRATDELSAAIRNSLSPDESYVFTNVPRRRGAILKYGLDHAAALSKSLAREFGCEYMRLLVSKSKRPQKNLEHDERIKNAQFDIRGNVNLKGKTVVIVDDIVTTGASIGHCATLIRSLSPKEIVGAAIAIAYFDDES